MSISYKNSQKMKNQRELPLSDHLQKPIANIIFKKKSLGTDGYSSELYHTFKK